MTGFAKSRNHMADHILDPHQSCGVPPELSSFLCGEWHSLGLPSSGPVPRASGSSRGPTGAASGLEGTAQKQQVPCRSHDLEELRRQKSHGIKIADVVLRVVFCRGIARVYLLTQCGETNPKV